jgi:pyrimidine-specific ribonucleoside hydrolase
MAEDCEGIATAHGVVSRQGRPLARIVARRASPGKPLTRYAPAMDPSAPSAAVPRPVVLDCDPGHDDALAIALAVVRPELGVLAITTVAGNAGLVATTRNAGRILALLGREDIPVAAGAERPIVREPWVPVQFHGESGLDGADLPEPTRPPVDVTAVELMTSLLRAAQEPVTIIATGPLTNVALLLQSAPGLRERIGGISLMGGSLGEGNTTASAEFNIWADPEAADVVFRSGIPIRMAGLDVTHQALVLPADVARLEGLGNRAGRVFADLMRFFAIHHRERYGWEGPPVHDAVAVAWLLEPDLVRSRALRVDIETGDGLTRGRTVADPEGLAGTPPNAEVGVAIDRERLIDVLVDAIGRVP